MTERKALSLVEPEAAARKAHNRAGELLARIACTKVYTFIVVGLARLTGRRDAIACVADLHVVASGPGDEESPGADKAETPIDFARVRAEAILAERGRVAAILCHRSAPGHEAQAQALALHSDLDVQACGRILDCLPGRGRQA